MMCATKNEPINRRTISHAIAYCETMLSPYDVGERSEMDILIGTSICPKTAVNILKQSVRYRRDIYGSQIILREMEQPDFLSYIARKLGYDN